MFGAAAALRDAIGTPPSPAELGDVAPLLAAPRDALGDEQFTSVWAAGQSLPQADAIAEALAAGPAPPDLPSPGVMDGPISRRELTRREREVLRLLAGGEDDAIGELPFISPATVARHVANLRGKLGVHSRAKVAAAARRHGLG